MTFNDRIMDKILRESGLKYTQNLKDMSEMEMEQTVSLFDKVTNNDLDRLIIHLQFIRAKKKRDFQKTQHYGFCDRCMRTYPAKYEECRECKKVLRILPIRVEYSYLLDGHKENKYWVEV